MMIFVICFIITMRRNTVHNMFLVWWSSTFTEERWIREKNWRRRTSIKKDNFTLVHFWNLTASWMRKRFINRKWIILQEKYICHFSVDNVATDWIWKHRKLRILFAIASLRIVKFIKWSFENSIWTNKI